jgi:hypothetical protein
MRQRRPRRRQKLNVAIVEAAFAPGDDREKNPAEIAAFPAKALNPMAPADSNRNLLFGILALQMDFITRDDLIAVMNAWLLQKHRSLGELLEKQGALGRPERALVEPLVNRHIEQHGGDPAQSLAAVSSVDQIRMSLLPAVQGDPQIVQSLNRLAQSRSGSTLDPYATVHDEGIAATPGSRFRIVRFHAKGGLGEVAQSQPIDLARRGLAILRPLMDSRPADNKLRNDVASGLGLMGYI